MAKRSKGFVNKSEVLMHLSISGCHRVKAAASAGVSDRTFRRWMRQARVSVPRSDTKLNTGLVKQMREQRGAYTRPQLSAQCGVSARTVDQVLSNQTWRRV